MTRPIQVILSIPMVEGVIVMMAAVVFWVGAALLASGASADADRGFRPSDQAPAGLAAPRINPLAKGN